MQPVKHPAIDPSQTISVSRDLHEVFDKLLQHAMMMHDTKAGTLQLLNKNNYTLEIVASSGLSDEFIKHFNVVTIDDGSVCGRALKSGTSVYVKDLSQDKTFAPHLNLALQNNITSVLSAPLISRNGDITGMISMHFQAPKKFPGAAFIEFEQFCRTAADKIAELTAG